MTDSEMLRGYDSYKVTLGDEMRGERASLGKSLLDVQRELRIRAAHIDAIENCDPNGIPYKGFVSGYVRAYARYLGMDEDDVMRRFCAESGFAPAATTRPGPHCETPRSAARRDDLDAVIAGSRLAAVSRAESMSMDLSSTLRGLGSLAVLATLLGGLGYGGWALLQNIQRVDFAPLSQPPSALAQTPDLGGVARVAQAGVTPAPALDSAALAALYAQQERDPPRIQRRDGPIAALDPARSGVFAPQPPAAPAAPPEPEIAEAFGPPAPDAFARAEAVERAEAAPARPAPTDAERGLSLVFAEEAWVRVRGRDGAVLHEGLMPAGHVWRAPTRLEGLTLRAGNAGGVYVDLDGTRYGPLGGRGAVVSNVPLEPETIRSTYDRRPRMVEDAGPVRSAGVTPR